MALIISLLVFGLIIIIHEFGHFWTAKKCGMLVEEFAIGMGPKIFGIRIGETLYSLRVFPIGGFCQILGEDAKSTSDRAFSNKSVLEKMLVILSGAFMNFLLSFIIFIVLISFDGASENKIVNVLNGYPAAEAGILPGDYLLKINNNKINISQDLSFYLADSKGKEINLTVRRDKKILDFKIKPIKSESGFYFLGFEKDMKTGVLAKKNSEYAKMTVFETISKALLVIAFYIKLTFIGLIRLLTLKLSVKDMSGPIGIVKAIGDTYNVSVAKSISIAVKSLANFTAVISANIAVFNLLPLPALDGGRFAFLLIEAITKRPFNTEREGFVHFVGFVILIIFAVVIAISDIMKLI
jgi:regulator of sigma E protease